MLHVHSGFSPIVAPECSPVRGKYRTQARDPEPIPITVALNWTAGLNLNWTNKFGCLQASAINRSLLSIDAGTPAFHAGDRGFEFRRPAEQLPHFGGSC